MSQAQQNTSASNPDDQNVEQNVQTELTNDDVQAIEQCFPNSTVKASYFDILKHKEATYLKSLLVYRENTEYYPTTQEKFDVVYIVSAQVMVHLIMKNEYEEIVIESEHDSSTDRILCPTSVESMYAAEVEVRKYPANVLLGAYFKKFEYLPMQHDLPLVRILEGEHNFYDWKPPLPTQENWREFIYAPTNIRYLKVTYAANCRHKLGHWDEHPWCAACLVKAGIIVCVHPDKRTKDDEYCYICDTMSPEAVSAFLQKIENWKTRAENQEDTTPKGRRLPTKIKCQLHADLATPKGEVDSNPAWVTDKQGICRPATCIPLYAMFADYKSWNKMQRQSNCTANLKYFKYRYNRDRATKTDEELVHWPDLEIFFTMAGKKNKSAQDTHEDTDKNSEDENLVPSKTTSGRNTPRRKKSPRKQVGKKGQKNESQSQREARLKNQRQKDKDRRERELKERREMKQEIKDLKDDKRRLELDMKKLREQKTRKDWSSASDRCTKPEFDLSASYNFNRAIKAASKLSKDVNWIQTEGPANKKRKVVHRSLFKEAQGYFAPNEVIVQKIDETLAQYAENTQCPELEEVLPVCLNDFPISAVLSKAPSSEPDVHMKFPADDDEVMVHQFEMLRLDSLNRAMVKVHECESALFSALVDNMDANRLQADEPPDDMIVLDAAAYCHTLRESLLAESTGIVIAARRRDNVRRQNVPEHHSTNIIAHPLLPKEKSLIMREKETQRGDGPGTSRNQ